MAVAKRSVRTALNLAKYSSTLSSSESILCPVIDSSESILRGRNERGCKLFIR